MTTTLLHVLLYFVIGAFAHVLDAPASFLDLRDVVDAERVNGVNFSLYGMKGNYSSCK